MRHVRSLSATVLLGTMQCVCVVLNGHYGFPSGRNQAIVEIYDTIGHIQSWISNGACPQLSWHLIAISICSELHNAYS